MVGIQGFQVIRPRFEIEQEASLQWIADIHALAERTRTGVNSPVFTADLEKNLLRLGDARRKIATRGVQIGDLFEPEPLRMRVYPVCEQPQGVGLKERLALFDQEVSPLFDDFYPEGIPSPDHLIHVTCTGYIAPSPAQKWVSRRGLGHTTTVTHAYHMGCYAAIPALRMASSFLQQTGKQADIVHTEICSLHMHPLKHTLEQLIVQSLFADGFIKYTVCPLNSLSQSPFFHIKGLREEIIPDSVSHMTWICEEHGFGMTLDKDVPLLIGKYLKGYLVRLLQEADLGALDSIFYAIHPGGPKIVESVQRLLGLKTSQVAHSSEILRTCGNMSSATLPHIWNLMLNDTAVPSDAYVVSLAFGPGLSIAGSIFQKGYR